MDEAQIAFLELIELLLSQVSDDPTYRHLRVDIDTDPVFIEDTVVNVLLSTKRYGIVIDMERCRSGDVVFIWNKPAAAAMSVALKNYYILEMLAGI